MDRQSIIDEDSVFSAPVRQNPKLIILQTVKDKTSKQAQFKVRRMMGYIMRDNSYNTQQPLNLSDINILVDSGPEQDEDEALTDL